MSNLQNCHFILMILLIAASYTYFQSYWGGGEKVTTKHKNPFPKNTEKSNPLHVSELIATF